uniref:Uncharacterized protein n=1 Tax=Globodera rostochiensis TaxID=31243 RepID=A0A914HCD6_GLORO
MNIYSRKFILCFLLFQPVLVLSEGPRNAHFSLSQMSLFLNKMDELLESKCIMNESALEEIRRVANIIIHILNEDFKSRSTFCFNLSEYFNVYISWHEPDENITAWKIDVLEQRFVQSLLDYDKGHNNNKMEMVLKNGIKHFLLTFQKKEKRCEIEIPSAIETMKAEIEKQIKSLNKKFTLSLNSVEQNRLFLLSMHKIALHFVQNLLVNGLLNDEERNGLVIDIKNKMYSIFEKDLKYFEGIEQYYYGIETGKNLKEWLEKFKNKQKNQNQLVSIEQIGSNESILAYFVAEKLADSIGDLLREGESLALLDWCHKNHRQISMTEFAYIVDKLRELLFPDVPIMEWERERERTLRLCKTTTCHQFWMGPLARRRMKGQQKQTTATASNLFALPTACRARDYDCIYPLPKLGTKRDHHVGCCLLIRSLSSANRLYIFEWQECIELKGHLEMEDGSSKRVLHEFYEKYDSLEGFNRFLRECLFNFFYLLYSAVED